MHKTVHFNISQINELPFGSSGGGLMDLEQKSIENA
nr:MAG TPA: hypothetical protein [Caudoviricetes sp.]